MGSRLNRVSATVAAGVACSSLLMGKAAVMASVLANRFTTSAQVEKLIHPDQSVKDELFFKYPLETAAKGTGTAGGLAIAALLGPLVSTPAGAIIGERIMQHRGRIARTVGGVVGGTLGMVAGLSGAASAAAAAGAVGSVMWSRASSKEEGNHIINGNAFSKGGIGTMLRQFDGKNGLWENTYEREQMIFQFINLLRIIKDPLQEDGERDKAFKALRRVFPVPFSSINDDAIPDATIDGVLELFQIASRELNFQNKDSNIDENRTLLNLMENAWAFTKVDIPREINYDYIFDAPGGIPNWAKIPRVVKAVLSDERLTDLIREIVPTLPSFLQSQISASIDFPSQCNDNLQEIIDLFGTSNEARAMLILPQALRDNFAGLVTAIGGSSSPYSGRTNKELEKSFLNNPESLFNTLNSVEKSSFLNNITVTDANIHSRYQDRGQTLFKQLPTSPIDLQQQFKENITPNADDMVQSVAELNGPQIYNAMDRSGQLELLNQINIRKNEAGYNLSYIVRNAMQQNGISFDPNSPLPHDFTISSAAADKRNISNEEKAKGMEKNPEGVMGWIKSKFKKADSMDLLSKYTMAKELVWDPIQKQRVAKINTSAKTT